MDTKIEYRLRPVTRYVVTRWEEGEHSGSCEERGEYDNADVAYEVAYALCKAEHDRLDYPISDERIRYPVHPSKSQSLGGVPLTQGIPLRT